MGKYGIRGIRASAMADVPSKSGGAVQQEPKDGAALDSSAHPQHADLGKCRK